MHLVWPFYQVIVHGFILRVLTLMYWYFSCNTCLVYKSTRLGNTWSRVQMFVWFFEYSLKWIKVRHRQFQLKYLRTHNGYLNHNQWINVRVQTIHADAGDTQQCCMTSTCMYLVDVVNLTIRDSGSRCIVWIVSLFSGSV